MTKHKDTPGVISKLSTIMYKDNLNIGTMKLYRNGERVYGYYGFTETDNVIPQLLLKN